MKIGTRRKQRWQLPEGAATSEALFWDRRRLIKMVAAGSMLAPGILRGRSALADVLPDPSAELYPATRNERFAHRGRVTNETDISRYNKYAEFGYGYTPDATALKTRPWEVTITGMVEKPLTFEIDELLKLVSLEERVYRHRCVETWAMIVSWTGFAMKALLDIARPLGSAKYVRIESFVDPAVAPAQLQSSYPWPYVEGMTITEAANDLTFLATGAYGKPLAKQSGAPLRLVVPWKYGFKSIKGIVLFEFTDQRPVSFWQRVEPSEYGFWANVNPAVPHPRWSQKREWLVGTDETRPTMIWNGYGEFVAQLYSGLKRESLFL